MSVVGNTSFQFLLRLYRDTELCIIRLDYYISFRLLWNRTTELMNYSVTTVGQVVQFRGGSSSSNGTAVRLASAALL